jgi:hypothetical protein
MHMGRGNPQNEYYMKVTNDIIKLEVSEEERDLGVVFDKELNFDVHINKIASKANQITGIIRKSFEYLDRSMFVNLYKTLVRPHLEYANIIWHPSLKRQSNIIERVQRRATKILQECKEMSYSERLVYLNLHSLKGRRLRGDLIEVFKIFNKLVDIEATKFFSLAVFTKTRNTGNKIFIKNSKTNKRKTFFSYRIAKIWNNLPAKIKNATSVDSFKNQLDSDKKCKDLFVDFD